MQCREWEEVEYGMIYHLKFFIFEKIHYFQVVMIFFRD